MSRFSATTHRSVALLLATGVGSLCLAIGVAAASASASASASPIGTGDQAVIRTAASSTRSTALAPAMRLETPVNVIVGGPVPVPAPIPVAATANRSTCRQDVDAAFTITIADIGYSCPVQAGDQSTLDSGAVTMIGDPSIQSALATTPGARGTMWVAGHRTSHGGAFNAVPDLAIGALVVVADGNVSVTYQVVARTAFALRNDRVVDAAGNATGEATLDAILRADHGGDGSPRLVLQTCDGAAVRWMIYADIVS